MSSEKIQFTVNQTPLDVRQELLRVIMTKHFTIKATDALDDRSVKTVGITNNSFTASGTRLEGYGEGKTIEAALVRALYKQQRYSQNNDGDHENTEKIAIEPDLENYQNSLHSFSQSQFDAIFYDEPVMWMMRDGDSVTVTCQSKALDEGIDVLTERDEDPITALELLVSRYHFRRRSSAKVMRLPRTLFSS